jgi:hypothetical protein
MGLRMANKSKSAMLAARIFYQEIALIIRFFGRIM